MTRRREFAALGLILALALTGRIAAASFGLWFDEFASLAFARQPLAALWSGWMVRETNPPLFYTLLKSWIALAGTGDGALRLLPILIGTGGIAFAWALARRLGGPLAGLAAAALIALSPSHFEYSLELRGYGLAHAAALAATLAAIAYVDRKRVAALAGYVLAATAALYAHTTMAAFVALAAVTTAWLLRGERRALLRWIVANLIVATLWAWWAAITVAQLAAPAGTIGWIAPPTPASGWATVERTYLGAAGGAGVALVTAALLGATAWLAWRERRTAALVPAVLALAAPPLLALLSLATPVLLPRTLFWASGPLLVAVAVALARLGERSRAVAGWLFALLLLVEAALLAGWLPTREKEGWRAALAAVARETPRPVVLVEGDAMALAAAHYAGPARIVMLAASPQAGDRWADGLVAAPIVTPATARILLERRRVFALRRGDSDPAARLRAVALARPWPEASGGRQPYVSRLTAR